MDNLSLLISRTVSYLAPSDILLGATFTGLSLTVLFTVFFISSYLFSVEKNIRRILLFLISLLFVNVVYVYLFAYFLSFSQVFQSIINGESTGLASPEVVIPERYLLNIPILLFIFLLVPLFIYLKKINYHYVKLAPEKAVSKQLFAILVLVAFSISSSLTQSQAIALLLRAVKTGANLSSDGALNSGK